MQMKSGGGVPPTPPPLLYATTLLVGYSVCLLVTAPVFYPQARSVLGNLDPPNPFVLVAAVGCVGSVESVGGNQVGHTW